jgi:N-acetylneuraminic acid mutarotase
MHSNRHPGKTRRARSRLAASILVVTAAVLGLPSVAQAETPAQAPTPSSGKVSVTPACETPKAGYAGCFALRRDDIKSVKGVLPNADAPAGYGPADLLSAYGLPTDGGAGATVAIVDAFDDPAAEADLAIYRQQFGLPACTTDNGCFKKIDQRGGTDYPAPDAGWAGEISLDVDMVSAIAPNAKILLVEADTNAFEDMGAAVNRAVASGAKYVSNSYGSGYTTVPGSGEDPSEVTELDQYYNHPGVAIVASTGDEDYGVAYPAASPYVTSVGGTALNRSAADPRGWSESVWHNSFGGPGSGCSVYEAKPAWQKDTGCANRAVADVSAVADPVTGVAVYQTYGRVGWQVYGGTSASSPIIAGVYAVAGTPSAGTYPSSYLYDKPTAFNDVTAGANGTCTPAYLCTAGAGYDGPTGLGTPKGVGAFATGPHGEIVGTVTDSATGAPISGATVTAGDGSATTDATGKYDIRAAVGAYDVVATAYGYSSKTIASVTVAQDSSVTENFALDAVPSSTVHGIVSDASGHGWPLYAKVTVDGVPGGGVYTDPGTGRYSLTLPQGSDYNLHFAPVYPGYATATRTVTVGATAVTANADVKTDTTSCDTAPGYKLTHHSAATQSFDASTAPDGWTVADAAGSTGATWSFAGKRTNFTGGTGNYAIVDSDSGGSGTAQDTTLTSPALAVPDATDPYVAFDTDYYALDSTATVQMSLDGGTTWSDIWTRGGTSLRGTHVAIPVPQAVGKDSLELRFHYTGSFAWWWELDNVTVGNDTCDVIPGGLVYGHVTDANTDKAVNGAQVSIPDAGLTVTTAATPDDQAQPDGFYWGFSKVTGSHTVNVADGHYVSTGQKVKIAADDVVGADFTLQAGQIAVTPATIDKTLAWQATGSATIKLTNTGTAPATVKLGERNGGSTPLLTGGAPLNKVKGTFSNRALSAQAGRAATAKVDVNPADAPWEQVADYPTAIMDNVVAYDEGKVYSVGGYDGSSDTTAGYQFDAEAGQWTAIAPASDAREAARGDFVNGKLVLSGGWGPGGAPDGKTEIYDPESNTWSTGASNPAPLAAAGKAVVDGKLYLVGGCTTDSCGTKTVEVYDAAADTWSTAAPYPVAVAWQACGAISGIIYCAGGNTDSATSSSVYAYDPGAGSWSQLADMPTDMWAAVSAAANGQLLVSGGVVDNSTVVTNQGYAYDPVANTWTAMPNANQTLYRSGGACGLYRIGGNPGGFLVPPVASSEVLPGFTNCGAASDVSWLGLGTTEVTLAPGKSAKVTVSLNADVPDITQPGLYTAAVSLGTDTPYAVPAVPVSMTVNPPKTWGKIAGTIKSAADGKAIAGATVQIDTWASSYTLKTKADGTYQLWLDTRNNPLQLIVAKDGFQPQIAKVKITKGATTTTDFSLKKS